MWVFDDVVDIRDVLLLTTPPLVTERRLYVSAHSVIWVWVTTTGRPAALFLHLTPLFSLLNNSITIPPFLLVTLMVPDHCIIIPL